MDFYLKIHKNANSLTVINSKSVYSCIVNVTENGKKQMEKFVRVYGIWALGVLPSPK